MAEPTDEIQKELTLKEKLQSVDLNNRDLWDSLNEENQKSLKGDFYILNRYISNILKGSREEKEHFVVSVNEYYNKNWFLLQKHPKLLWLSLCMCSRDGYTLFFHKWIGNKKKDPGNNKKIQFLAELNPTMKMSEVEMLAKLTPDKELKALAKDYGFDDSTIKKKFK